MKKVNYKSYIKGLKLALDKELTLPQTLDESSYRIELPQKIINYLEGSKSSHPFVALDRTCVLINRIERQCRKHLLFDAIGSAIVYYARKYLKDLVRIILTECRGKDNIDYRTKHVNQAIREHLPGILYYLDSQLSYVTYGGKFVVEYDLTKENANKMVELVEKELGFKPYSVRAR